MKQKLFYQKSLQFEKQGGNLENDVLLYIKS